MRKTPPLRRARAATELRVDVSGRLGAQRREILVDCPKQAFGLGAVALQELLVVGIGDLADAALVFEIFQRLQHGALLLLGGARRSEGERFLEREGRVAREGPHARPQDCDDS